MDPEFWPRQKGPFSNNDDNAGFADTSDLPKKKGPRVDGTSLSPTQGGLKGRLNHESRTHMPLPPLSVNAACQLHCWAHKETNTRWRGQMSSRLVHAHMSCNVRNAGCIFASSAKKDEAMCIRYSGGKGCFGAHEYQVGMQWGGLIACSNTV